MIPFTDIELLENETAIATFMDLKIYQGFWITAGNSANKETFVKGESKFHKSFDWLTPVAIKIHKDYTKKGWYKFDAACTFYNYISKAYANFDVVEAYKSIVSLLNWVEKHNTQARG